MRRAGDRGVWEPPCSRIRIMVPTVLTDDHLAAIAWADPGERTAALARRLGAAYTPVYTARRRMRQAGGRWCPLRRVICTECGQPLLANATTHPRTNHPGCERARERRRQQTPAAVLASSERDRRRRERDPARVVALFAAWKIIARQELAFTQERATQAGALWTEEEDEEVLRRSDAPARAIALDLGRSTSAVFARRHRLRRQRQAKAVR
jgi:hypothetical protein